MLALDDDIRELPGSTKAREHLVTTAIDYLDGLGSEAKNDRELSMEAANGYMLAAEIKGVPSLPSLGKYKEAEAILAKAARLVDPVLEKAPRRADALLLAAEIDQDWMIVASTEQDGPETLAHSRRAAARAEALTHIPGIDSYQRNAAARIMLNSAQGLMNMHRYPEAAPLISRSLDSMRASGSPSGACSRTEFARECPQAEWRSRRRIGRHHRGAAAVGKWKILNRGAEGRWVIRDFLAARNDSQRG